MPYWGEVGGRSYHLGPGVAGIWGDRSDTKGVDGGLAIQGGWPRIEGVVV